MRVGSLFSGCGGTALGFEWSGYEHAWFVEREPYAQAVLRKNFPGAVVYGDITKVDFKSVPRVDVLEGGFPCQDISNAGKRAGIEGSRSSLWKDFRRAISDLRPQFVSIENVAALTGRGLDVVLCDLAALGYDAEWHCVSASAVGAPHRRDRIFILAYGNLCGCVHGQTQEQPTEGGQQTQPIVGCCSEDVSDTSRERLQGQCESERVQKEHTNNGEHGWWSVEPCVGRVANGVSNRVDRIKCLGNAVVPQNAEVIAKAIKEVAGVQ